MLLYVIRHGEPDYANDCLTQDGEKQAQALAKRLKQHGVDEVYSSPLGRAVATATPTCEIMNLECQIEPWMSEDKVFNSLSAVQENGERDWAFGGQSSRLIEGDNLNKKWYENPVFSRCDSPISPLEFYKHMQKCSDDFMERLGYKREGTVYRIIKPNEKRIAAFCHHGFGTVWLSHLLNIPPHIFWAAFDIHHSSVTILELKNHPDNITAPQCMCLADISHIYKEKLPLKAAIDFFRG